MSTPTSVQVDAHVSTCVLALAHARRSNNSAVGVSPPYFQ